jgi:hypothetical protein
MISYKLQLILISSTKYKSEKNEDINKHVKGTYIVNPVYYDHPWAQNLRPLLTSGRCSKVALCRKKWNGKSELAVGRWSLFGGGR